MSEIAKHSGKCSSSLNKKLIAAFLAAGTVVSVSGSAWAADDDPATQADIAALQSQIEILQKYVSMNPSLDSGAASASGLNSIAIGPSASTTGDGDAMAIGFGATATNSNPGSGSGQFGKLFTAMAIGSNSYADGERATAIGHGAYAQGLNALTIGSSVAVAAADGKKGAVGNNAIAIGEHTVAYGYNAEAVGSYSRAIGESAVALGQTTWATEDYATASGSKSQAIGIQSTTNGAYSGANTASVAIGGFTQAGTTISSGVVKAIDGAIFATAVGYGSHANVKTGVALGAKSVAEIPGGKSGYDPKTKDKSTDTSPTWKSSYGAVSVGAAATTETDDEGNQVDVPQITRQITNVAAGYEETDAVNVAQLKAAVSEGGVHYYSVNDGGTKQGNYNNDGATGANSGSGAMAAGPGALAVNTDPGVTEEGHQGKLFNATAVGSDSYADGEGAAALGAEARAKGLDAIAIGRTENGDGKGAIGTNAIAIGAQADARGYNTIAIGGYTVTGLDGADVEEVTVLGSGAWGTANYATALGSRAQAVGTWSLAAGAHSGANENSVAVGPYSMAGTTQKGGVVSPIEGKTNATAVGLYSNAIGARSAAEGAYSAANDYSVAYGYMSMAGTKGETVTDEEGNKIWVVTPLREKDQTTAVGYYSAATGTQSSATGAYSQATGDYSTANGYYGRAGGAQSTAVGYYSRAGITKDDKTYGNYSTAVGAFTNYSLNDDELKKEGTTALGYNSAVKVDNGVALGRGSIANVDKGVFGYDPITGAASKDETKTWKSTMGAVSVGDSNNTRQITNVAAGYELTDAVNVAQLATSRVEIKAGDNITVATSIAADGHAIYTLSSSPETVVAQGTNVTVDGPTSSTTGGDTDTGNDTTDGGTTESGTYTTNTYTVNAANSKVTEVAVTKGTPSTTGNKTETKYTIAVTSEEQDVKDGKIDPKPVTVTKTDEFTITDVDTKYTAKQETEEGSTTFTVSEVDGEDVGVAKLIAGENVQITKGEDGSAIISAQAGGIAEISFNGDNKDAQIDNPKVLNIEGGATGELSDGNIGVESDGKDTLTVKLAKDIKGVDSITVNKNIKVGDNTTIEGDTITTKTVNADTVKVGGTTVNDNGITTNNGNGPSVTKDGIDAGGKKITNVAPGTADNDAATVSQLKNASGDIYNEINRLDNSTRKGIAGAAALAALHPMDFNPDDKLQFSAGVGNYRGETAAAVGMFYRPDESVMFSLGGTFGNSDNMVNAGITFGLDGTRNRITRSRTAMAREIQDLRSLVTQMAARMDRLEGANVETAMFPDVPENHWAYEYVEDLQKRGALKGYPDGLFKGDRAMTRYEFAAMLDRLVRSGVTLDSKIAKEFEPELGRIYVERISGQDNDRKKVERVRVNNSDSKYPEGKTRDVYGSKIVTEVPKAAEAK